MKKRIKAAKMFLSGYKPGTICSKLSLNPDTFWNYVYQFQLEEAIKLHEQKVPDEVICSKLQLEKEALKQNPLKIHFSENIVNRNQPGKSDWITEICTNKNSTTIVFVDNNEESIDYEKFSSGIKKG